MPDPTHYLYKVQPTRLAMLSEGATEGEAEIVGRHFEYLKGLSEERVVVLAGRTLHTDESSFGIVILRADSEADARRVMEHDPAVAGGVMRAALYPYRIALMANGQRSNVTATTR
jgi:uncharacterized protein YciI